MGCGSGTPALCKLTYSTGSGKWEKTGTVTYFPLRDAAGRQVSVTNPLGKITTSVYDNGSRVIATVDPLNKRTTMEYDDAGQVICMLDANGKRTTLSHDALGRLLATTDANGSITTNVYDAAGNRTAVLDSRGNRLTYTYDSRGLQTELVDQLARRTTYGYDAAGRQQWRLDPKGQRVTFVYDNASRLTRQEYSDGSRATFTYDATGNRLTMQDGTGTQTFSYNAVHMPESVTHPGPKIVTYAYNEVGGRSVMLDPDGGRSTYAYDAANRMTSLLNPFAERTTFVYDAASQRITQRNANGAWVSYSYDDGGRMTRVVNLKSDNTTLSSFIYTLDNVGNKTVQVEASGDRVTYSYDSAYQLTRERRSGAAAYDITYTYDPVGNRLTKVEGGATTTYVYDAANQIQTEQTPSQITTFTFDNNGNLQVENAGGSRTTYTWNIENMCVGIALPNATLNTFAYDADLVRRQAEDSEGLRKFVNDEQNVLLETDSGGTTQAAYTLEPAAYGNLLSQRRSGATAWHLYDALGSTDRLTDASQADLASYVRTAFGVPKAATGSHPNRLTFGGRVGYRWEPDTQQYDVRRRRYKAGRGQWLGTDPVYPVGNWYTYAWSSPLSLVDPSGELPYITELWELVEWLEAHPYPGHCDSVRVAKIRRAMDLIATIGGALFPVASASLRYWLSGEGGERPIPWDTLMVDAEFLYAYLRIEADVLQKVCSGLSHYYRSVSGTFGGVDLFYAFHQWDSLSATGDFHRTGQECTTGFWRWRKCGVWVEYKIVFKFSDAYDWGANEATSLPFIKVKFRHKWALELKSCSWQLYGYGPRNFTTVSKKVLQGRECCV